MAERKTQSPVLVAVHDTAKGLHEAGVMDLVTLREFDRLCLPSEVPVPSAPTSATAQPRGPARPSEPDH